MSHQQDGGDLKRVESYQWPSAHVGHLSPNQQAALDKFRALCEQKGYYKPASEDGKTPASHDDETLLRYLRARKFIPNEAFGQLKDTEDWRRENQLDTLYETIDVEEYDLTRRLYPQWTGRRDKRGIPFYVYEIANVDAKAVSAHNSDKDAKHVQQSTTAKTPRKMMRLFALYENLCRFVLPLCSAIPDRPHSETPISQSSNVVDLSKVGFAKFWSLRNHMSDASTLATAHYPETLDHIFVVGAPSFFPTVWEWAKRWFDPITVSKISILSKKDMLATLEKYVDIENIPKKYGGKLDWEFGDRPFLEPAIVNSLHWNQVIEERGHRTLPFGPIKWQYDEKGDLVATAIGSENGKPRHDVIAGLHPDSKVARLALSPGRAEKSYIGVAAAASQSTSASSAPVANGSVVQPAKPKMSSDANDNVGKSEGSAAPASSRAGTYTIPYRDDANNVASPPVDSRQGTTSTRFEQQDGTHAEGQMADGTPHLRTDGQGTEHGIMEPATVGQAPKEHPVPEVEGEQPSIVDQAKHYAEQAYEQAVQLPQTVMSAVGMAGKKEEEEPKVESKHDPAIDNLEGKHVEEFLRSKTLSTGTK